MYSRSRVIDIESETAEEGLKLIVEKGPDLILMDIQLPGMDGITAMKQLKADPGTTSIPVIAITASAMTHNRTTMLAEGFDGYQTKPISLKDFLGEVERVLAKNINKSEARISKSETNFQCLNNRKYKTAAKDSLA